MKASELTIHLENIRYKFHELNTENEVGYLTDYQNENGIATWEFNAKTCQQYEKQLRELAVSLWSLKDILKLRMTEIGKNPHDVEDHVNSRKYLMYLSDIANYSKHGALSRSRSGLHINIQRVNMSLPSGLSMSVLNNGPVVKIGNPKEITYHTNVYDTSGKYRGKAETILVNAFSDWIKLLNKRRLLQVYYELGNIH